MITAIMIPTQAVSATTVSGVFQLGDTSNYSVAFVFTGSNVGGTAALYGSNDGINFPATATKTATVSSSGNVLLSDSNVGYGWVQVSFASGTGTGNITATLIAKQNKLEVN